MKISKRKLQEYGYDVSISKTATHGTVISITTEHALNSNPYFEVAKSFGLTDAQAAGLAEAQIKEIEQFMLAKALQDCQLTPFDTVKETTEAV